MVLEVRPSCPHEPIHTVTHDLDTIVAHQSVPLQNKLQGAFALSYARWSQQQDTQSENVQEHAVNGHPRRQTAFKVIGNPRDRHRALERCSENGN